MAHRRFEYDMPAGSAVVFDAFHQHRWRERWDPLVSRTRVVGGAPCPSVGAVTENTGGGLLRALSMRTRFVSYDRPRVAAATMVGRAFPFSRWAASMRHRPVGEDHSRMTYTYRFEVMGPRVLRRPFDAIVQAVFDWQTQRRFARFQRFLQAHGPEVAHWQAHAGAPGPARTSPLDVP